MEYARQASCVACERRPERPFCDFPSDALRAFDAIKSFVAYPRGSTLFAEGRPPRGIFVLCDGRAKLYICSEGGKRLMLRTASPGEVLGVSSALSGRPYEVTAEALDACKVAFVKRKELLKFLRDYREATLHLVHLLSGDLHVTYERLRSIGLSRTRRPRASVRPGHA